MSLIAGSTPDQLQLLIEEELRVITENPYEFEGDDNAKFRALLPHQLPAREHVLSIQKHVDQVRERVAGNNRCMRGGSRRQQVHAGP